MFKNLQEYARGHTTLELDLKGETTARDLQVATLALLVEVAHSNHSFAEGELNRIVTSMFVEFGVESEEAGLLMEITNFLRKERGELDSFIATINQHFNSDQKQRILALVWRIIVADGEADKNEAELAVELRKKLNLTLEQAVRAQQLSREAHDLSAIIADDEI